MEEIWKDIKGFEGYYQVSTLGRVKSLNRSIICKNGTQRIFWGTVLKTRKSKNGYILCNLKKFGKTNNKRVNRLVADAFIPNPHNLPQVNHIDFDKNNNSVCNLEWVTGSENIQYNYDKAMSNAQRKVQRLDRYSLDVLEEYVSMAEASRRIKGNYQNISRTCKNINYTHKGYKWRIIDD